MKAWLFRDGHPSRSVFGSPIQIGNRIVRRREWPTAFRLVQLASRRLKKKNRIWQTMRSVQSHREMEDRFGKGNVIWFVWPPYPREFRKKEKGR
jgi:hypothetical protein